MSSREGILEKLRKNRPDPKLHPLPDPVRLGDEDNSRERFEKNLLMMGGELLPMENGNSLADGIKERYPDATNICSAVPDFEGNIRIDNITSPQEAANIDVLVVRSPFAIAEMGAIYLSEKELSDKNYVGHLTQHLVVLLSPKHIIGNMHLAYLTRPEFKERRYGVVMAGPSATADIQGVLVRGAQGVRTLCVAWDKT